MSKNECMVAEESTNELIKTMGQKILDDIIGEINSAQWYAIIADEASDVSGSEQLSVTVQWVNKNYEVHWI